MKKTRLFVALAVVIGFAAASYAQVKPNSIFTTGKADVLSTQVQHNNQVKDSRLMITHSTSQNIVAGTVACVDQTSGFTAENHYIRVFDLLNEFSISGSFNVTSVEFGVENSTPGDGVSQPVSVRLYTLNGSIAFANMTPLAEANSTIPTMSAAHHNVPITATVGNGQKLVVDIYIPDGQPNSHVFFLGSNNLGQTAPSYLASNDCGVADPLTYAAIGFPNVHLVINVYGEGSASINEFASRKIEVWPNPASDKVYFNLPKGSWNVELLNLNGKQIYQSEMSGEASLDVEMLPKGIYLLRATNGSSVLQDKIMIQ